MDAGRRVKRRCATRCSDDKAKTPSAVHYVGYVEDDETPESIARKFEELDRIQAAGRGASSLADAASPDAAAAADAESGGGGAATEGGPSPDVAGPPAGELTDEQLMEVFKQTSIFTVRSAADNNSALMHQERGGAAEAGYRSGDELLASDDDDDSLEALHGFWSDADDEDYSEHWKKLKRLKSSRRAPREKGAAHPKPRHDVITHYNAATQALIRRKVRQVDPEAIVRIQVPPPPLPVSWGRTVQPWSPPHLRSPRRAAAAGSEPDPLGRSYQAVLVNPGWVPADRDAAAAAAAPSEEDTMAAFRALPMPRLCPVGFVFVWADKVHLHPVVKQMYHWGFVYIENLTWVQLHPNNQPLLLPSQHARRSHLTMLMFRRDGLGKDIELRHQRKPDVFFDCMRSTPDGGWAVPEEAYVALETMLPTGKGNFLELWAAAGSSRDGWTQIPDVLVW